MSCIEGKGGCTDIHCSAQNFALFVDLLWNIFWRCYSDHKRGNWIVIREKEGIKFEKEGDRERECEKEREVDKRKKEIKREREGGGWQEKKR